MHQRMRGTEWEMNQTTIKADSLLISRDYIIVAIAMTFSVKLDVKLVTPSFRSDRPWSLILAAITRILHTTIHTIHPFIIVQHTQCVEIVQKITSTTLQPISILYCTMSRPFNQKQINSILKINAENFLDGWIKGGKLLSDKDKDTKLDLSRKHTKHA